MFLHLSLPHFTHPFLVESQLLVQQKGQHPATGLRGGRTGARQPKNLTKSIISFKQVLKLLFKKKKNVTVNNLQKIALKSLKKKKKLPPKTLTLRLARLLALLGSSQQRCSACAAKALGATPGGRRRRGAVESFNPRKKMFFWGVSPEKKNGGVFQWVFYFFPGFLKKNKMILGGN